MLTPEEIAEIKARVEAANPGPWRVEVHEPSLSRMVYSEDHTLDIDFGYVGNCTQEAAEFVAHARTDVPALLAEVERLRALLEDTRARGAERLKAAEDLCVMYSWSPARHITDRDKAAHELWRRWHGIVGSDFLKAEAHPDLSDEMVALLAAQRDETRARTIARIRPDGNADLPGGEG